MKHDVAIRAMDEQATVRAVDGDEGFIVALGRYDTANCHNHERSHPLNKRGWALVSWGSGTRTWIPLCNLEG